MVRPSEDLQEFVQGLTSSLDALRGRLADWAADGPGEVHTATRGGVEAEASLAAGVTALRIDPAWAEGQDMDDVARHVVEAVNAAEDAGRASLWASLADLRIGTTSFADLGVATSAGSRLEGDPAETVERVTRTATAGTEEEHA